MWRLKFPTSKPASQALLPTHIREVHTGCLIPGLLLDLAVTRGSRRPPAQPDSRTAHRHVLMRRGRGHGLRESSGLPSQGQRPCLWVEG